MTIAVCVLLLFAIILAGIQFYEFKLIEDLEKANEQYKELVKVISDLAKFTANEQSKGLRRLSVAEERILNLQSRTGQMQIKLKKMDANAIYEVKDGE